MIHSVKVPNHEYYKELAFTIVEAADQWFDYPYDYSRVRVLPLTHGSSKVDSILKLIEDLYKQEYSDTEPFELQACGLNKYETGTNLAFHKHLGVIPNDEDLLISCCYFVNIPEDSESEMQFEVAENELVSYNKDYEGYIVFFPPWMLHRATTNQSNEDRITIAANIMRKREC